VVRSRTCRVQNKQSSRLESRVSSARSDTAIHFLDNLAHGNTGGGSEAAKLLKKAILQQLDQLGHDVRPAFGDRIVVRIYTNLRGLSGEEQDSSVSRGMAEFAAGFFREELSYDFVDVGDYNVVQNKILGKHS
jgi:hypothetical protein